MNLVRNFDGSQAFENIKRFVQIIVTVPGRFVTRVLRPLHQRKGAVRLLARSDELICARVHGERFQFIGIDRHDLTFVVSFRAGEFPSLLSASDSNSEPRRTTKGKPKTNDHVSFPHLRKGL